jgi:hypothetical protein
MGLIFFGDVFSCSFGGGPHYREVGDDETTNPPNLNKLNGRQLKEEKDDGFSET